MSMLVVGRGPGWSGDRMVTAGDSGTHRPKARPTSRPSVTPCPVRRRPPATPLAGRPNGVKASAHHRSPNTTCRLQRGPNKGHAVPQGRQCRIELVDRQIGLLAKDAREERFIDSNSLREPIPRRELAADHNREVVSVVTLSEEALPDAYPGLDILADGIERQTDDVLTTSPAAELQELQPPRLTESRPWCSAVHALDERPQEGSLPRG